MASCFFIGHRETSSEIFPALLDAVLHHIAYHGVTEFIVGNYGNFDRLSAKAVITAKAHYPEITLSMLIPYHPAERPIKLPQDFDNSFFPPGMEKVPRKFAIVRANQYMIHHVDHLIAYAWHPASNARELVELAKKREAKGLITVTLLNDPSNGI